MAKRGTKSQAELTTVRPPARPPLPRPADLLPPAPAHLRKETAKWWREVVSTYEVEGHHLHLLRLCCEAMDRCEEARLALAENGPIYRDRFGCPRPHPSVAIERDARISVARLMREIGLDSASPPTAPRPHPLPGYR